MVVSRVLVLRRPAVRRQDTPPGYGLLAVALDLAGRPDVRALRVLAALTASPSLTQQVPALVQLDLELAQPRLLVGAGVPARLGLLAQRMLLVDEGVDLVKQSGVVHGALLRDSVGVRGRG